MTELDLVNDCLSTMGEAPLNDVDEDHPFVAGALRLIRLENERFQGMGWWFNTERLTLLPDPINGSLTVPGDALSFNPFGMTGLVQRGMRMYDTLNGTYEIGQSITGKLIRNVPVDYTPTHYQFFLRGDVVMQFQRDYDADRVKAQQIAGDYQLSFAMLRAEHIRQSRANVLLTAHSASALNRIRPGGDYYSLPYPGIGTR